MIRDILIDILIIAGILGTIGLFIAGVVMLGQEADAHSCRKYGEEAERATKYNRWTGCLVKTQAGWRSLGEQRTLDTGDSQLASCSATSP